ncbi:MAG: type II secretion system protein GspD [Calditrichia bacterium]
MRILLVVVVASFLFKSSFAQLGAPRELRKGYASNDEIVSMTKSLSFARALEIFNDISKKYLGKIIIDPENRTKPIGINIDKMHWMDAFELILKSNDLWYEELDTYIKIIPISEALKADEAKEEPEGKVNFFTREVIISAVFFEANESMLRQMGMSWKVFYGKDVNANINMSAADNKSGLFQIDIDPNLDFADIMATFKALENTNAGEILASPQITVRSGEKGRIQVGSDIAVTLRDFAGNAITQFFSTGIIIDATPQVLVEDSINFVYLDLNIERSNTSTSGENLEIKKAVAETEVLLLDGEETLIGGLYITEDQSTREGIPFLKDLPWWFFGLRYIFGFESVSHQKKEMLMLLKVDLLPTLEERYEAKLRRARDIPILMEQRKKMQKEMKDYWKQSQKLKK